MSNLLSQASLVMIPSGYKEDVVYSQIPTNGNGDLSFTRASNGTRVNSAGLVEVCPWNLVQYSEDFSNAYWTKLNTTITTNATTAPNGTTTADKVISSAVNDEHLVYYFESNILSQVVTMSAYVKKADYRYAILRSVKNGGYQISVFDLDNGIVTSQVLGASIIESVGNGWYRISTTFTAPAGLYGVQYAFSATQSFSYLGDGTSGNFLWGAQLNIGATAKPYFPTTDRLNVPRLTYQNGGGGCPSLLLEKQSTNLVAYSEQFDNAAWTKSNITVTANDAISPDGTQNADKITSTNASNTIQLGISSSSGVDYTISVFAKNIDAGNVRLDMSNVAFGPVFTFSTKTFTTVSGWTTSYQEFANGWFRLIATRQSNSTSASPQFGLNSVVGSVYLWGAQFEQSSYPTSYIPTTSSSATRVADNCKKTGISSLFGTNQGTFFIDFLYVNSETSDYLFDVTATSASQRFLLFDGGSNSFAIYDSTVGIIAYYTLTKGQRYKIAVKYNSTATTWYINGSSVATGGAFAYQMAEIYLGQRYTEVQQTQMQVNQTIIFPTALTNAELASLTTI